MIVTGDPLINVSGWFTLITAFFSLALVLAAGFALFRSQVLKTRMELLTGIVDTYKIKTDQQEAEIKELKTDLKTEKQKVRTLQEIAVGKAELENIQTTLNRHDEVSIRLTNELKAKIDLLVEARQ